MELTSFDSEVPSFYNTLDKCQHLLINLSRNSAGKPVNALYYT